MNAGLQNHRVMITGDSGLLGANMCFLWHRCCSVLGVSRGQSYVQGVRHVCVDLLDEPRLATITAEFRPEIIIHTAALVNVDRCEDNPAEAYAYNAKATQTITFLAKKYGAQLVYISTDAFYCGLPGTLAQENDLLVLNNEYGRTKRLGEQYALTWAKSLVLRTNFFGVNLQDKSSFSEWILTGLRGKQTLTMATDVNFSPILVNDLVLLIEKALEKGIVGLYNAGCTGSISKYDFALCVRDVFDTNAGKIVPISVENLKFSAWRSSNMAMDNTRLATVLRMNIPTAPECIARLKTLYNQKYDVCLKGALCCDTNR